MNKQDLDKKKSIIKILQENEMRQQSSETFMPQMANKKIFELKQEFGQFLTEIFFLLIKMNCTYFKIMLRRLIQSKVSHFVPRL